MNQSPYDQPQQPSYAPQPPVFAPPASGPWAPPPTTNIGLGITAIVWAAIGLVGHTVIALYLGLGAIMTHTLDGVFGNDPGGTFNFTLLLIVLIGQLLGLAFSVVAMLIGIGAKKKRMRRATTAMVLGIVATATFLLIGLIQLPVTSLIFDVLQLRANS